MMKTKMFFLLMAMSLCLASSALAFDESRWEIEEQIDLGEFPLGKADLTGKMGHEIIRLNALPDGRFVQIYVRTNKVGSVEKNKQLAIKRGQSVISMLRRVVSVEKLPNKNLEVTTGRFDEDKVDAQGAWIKIYKPCRIVYAAKAKTSSNDSNMKKSEQSIDNGMYTMAMVITVVAFGCLMLLCSLFVPVVRDKNRKKMKKEGSLGVVSVESPIERLNSLVEISAADFEIIRLNCPATTVVNITDSIAIGIIGCVVGEDEYPTFDVCRTGVRHPTTVKKWKQSVRLTVRHWLSGNDKNSDGKDRNFSLLLEAVKNKEVMRIK